MADPNPFVIELEDFGQRYEKAKARKLARDQESMDFYKDFQQINGPFSEGTKGQMQELWGEIENQFTLGNASPKGRAKIKTLYNQYSSLAADALNLNQKLLLDLKSIEDTPASYRNPFDLKTKLKEAQKEKFNIFDLDNVIKGIPSAAQNRLYTIEGESIEDTAKNISEQFGTSFLYPGPNGEKISIGGLKEKIQERFLNEEVNPDTLRKILATYLKIANTDGTIKNVQELQNAYSDVINLNEDGKKHIKLISEMLANGVDRRLDTINPNIKDSEKDTSVKGYGIGPFSAQDFYFSETIPEGFDESSEDNIYKRGEPVVYENVLSLPDIKLSDPYQGSEPRSKDDKIIVKGITFDEDGNKLYLVESDVYGVPYDALGVGQSSKTRTRTVFLSEDQVRGVVGALDGLTDKEKKYFNSQLKIVEKKQKDYYESIKNELDKNFINPPDMKEGGVIKQGPISRAFNAVKKIITRS